jgi:hypothetical protein
METSIVKGSTELFRPSRECRHAGRSESNSVNLALSTYLPRMASCLYLGNGNGADGLIIAPISLPDFAPRVRQMPPFSAFAFAHSLKRW